MKAAKRLSNWLTKNQQTQSALAAQLGVTRAAVHQWLTGDNRPSLDMAFALERATDGYVRARDWAQGGKR